jgi:dTDP-4-dehydrorhamnose reductase
MSRVLVFGAYGLLGNTLCRKLVEHGHIVYRQGRATTAEVSIDPADTSAVFDVLLQTGVDVVVNLIALTNVDQCEIDPQSAYRANVQITESVARALSRLVVFPKPHLVQISTDQVYGGHGPHVESRVDPCNVYGLSKLAAEFAASTVGATVLRVNFIGRSNSAKRTSLTDWIVNALRRNEQITVFDDILFNALHIDTLCLAIELVIRKSYPGTFNVGCSGGNSKAYLAFGLARRLGLDPNLMTVGRAQDSLMRVRRPLDMRMNAGYFEKTFDFTAPTFESQIDLTAQEYRHDQTTTRISN